MVFLIALALAKGAVVLGVVLLLRAGLISFGHALYFATGAYTVGFLANKLNIGEALIALPLAVVISAAVAAVLGLLLARFRGIYFAMLSLAFSMILYTALVKFYDFSGGTDGLSIRGFTLAGMAPAQSRPYAVLSRARADRRRRLCLRPLRRIADRLSHPGGALQRNPHRISRRLREPRHPGHPTCSRARSAGSAARWSPTL